MAAWVAVVNIALVTARHVLLPARWAVTAMAGAYTPSYAIGLLVTARLLRRRAGGRLDDGTLRRTYAKLLVAAGLGAALGWTVARLCGTRLGTGTAPTTLSLTAGTLTLAVVHLTTARLPRAPELRRLPGLR
ncbi:hypothetical protein [Streptomyces eurythermus]|uniref:hypothetical protein n=1 Tax=Streptomyces eurythermus TaxID=42237 RepID=UPI0034086209